MTRCAVYGTGSWGTAFAMVLGDAGCEVTMWGRRAGLVDAINTGRTNPDYLPDAQLPESVRATTDPAEAARGADFTVLAVPSQTLRGNLAEWAPLLPADTVLVSLMKGVELGTAKRMSEVIEEVAKAPAERVAVLTGPNLAKEIAARQPAAAVVACADEAVARRLQAACHTRTSARTPTPTWSERSWAARSRTSSRWRSAWPAAWAWATTPRPPDHPRPRRNHPAGPGDGRRRAHLRRARRNGRPGRHLLLAALPQQHLRGQPRPRHVAGGDHRGHQADRRGRQVLRVGTGSGPPARRRHADHRDGRGHRPRGQAAAGGPQGADVAQRKPERH